MITKEAFDLAVLTAKNYPMQREYTPMQVDELLLFADNEIEQWKSLYYDSRKGSEEHVNYWKERCAELERGIQEQIDIVEGEL